MGAHELVATATVEAGRLTIHNRPVFADALKAMRDGEVLVRIERAKATRSQQANRFYWGVVIASIADHTGYTPDECHDLMKAMFLPKTLALTDGNGEIVGEYVLGGSTAKLDVGAFADYVTRIQQWANEKLGVNIPEPDYA